MAYEVIEHIGFQSIGQTSTTQQHPLGAAVDGWDPTYGKGKFIYLKGVANTVVGSVVAYDAKNGTTTLAVAATKGPLAVAMSANVASQYGWYCLRAAVVPVNCAAAAAAGVAMYVTATAGAVDDAAVAGQGIDGLVLVTAAGGAGVADAEVNYPNAGSF